MKNSIRIPARYEKMVRELAGDKKETKVFNTYKDFVVFVACLGRKYGEPSSFKKSMDNPIRLNIFRDEFDLSLMNALAIVESNDINLLGTQGTNKRLEIFENYACKGFEVFENKVYNQGGDVQIQLLKLIISEAESSGNILDDITSFVDDY